MHRLYWEPETVVKVPSSWKNNIRMYLALTLKVSAVLQHSNVKLHFLCPNPTSNCPLGSFLCEQYYFFSIIKTLSKSGVKQLSNVS